MYLSNIEIKYYTPLSKIQHLNYKLKSSVFELKKYIVSYVTLWKVMLGTPHITLYFPLYCTNYRCNQFRLLQHYQATKIRCNDAPLKTDLRNTQVLHIIVNNGCTDSTNKLK